MFKVYNTQFNVASDLKNFFKNVVNNISKPHLKLIPYIILGMIQAESIVTSDIVKKLKGDFSFVQPFSNIRRLERFFNNPKFNIYYFYDCIIKYVISNFKSKNNNIYIAFDHMYCRDDFTILLFSLRIGKQGIPLWFRCFKGMENPEAFKTQLILDGISYTYNLFKDKKYNLIFLADRWFPNTQTLSFIDSIGATYCVRARNNLSIRINDFEYADTIGSIADIEPFLTKSKFFDNVTITKNDFHTKLAVSKSESHNEPFFILTNGNTRDAIKHYGYRFGSIEFIFKNQNLMASILKILKCVTCIPLKLSSGLMCVALLWLTILGADYSKNKNHFKNFLKINYSKKNGLCHKRTFSIFNTGLFYFNLAFESSRKATIKCNFLLYDI